MSDKAQMNGGGESHRGILCPEQRIDREGWWPC